MPKANYTHIAIVMDRSSSMSGIARDMEGGLKNFISEQKKVEGQATITLAKFDDQYELIYDFVDINQATNFSLQPRGGTALLDAMGRTMTEVRERINTMSDEERPNKVVFIFITDGEENSSRTHNRQRIFEMISDLRNAENDVNRPDENGTLWEFVFLGANQDAIAEGGNLGIRASASLTYDASQNGTQVMFASLARSMTSYRTAAPDMASYNFSQEDREAQNVNQSVNQNVTKTTTTNAQTPKTSRNMKPVPDLYGTILDVQNAVDNVDQDTKST